MKIVSKKSIYKEFSNMRSSTCILSFSSRNYPSTLTLQEWKAFAFRRQIRGVVEDAVELEEEAERVLGVKAKILSAACSAATTIEADGLPVTWPGKMEASTTKMLSVP